MASAQQFPSPHRPALVISHPGHELRVFGWMATFRPRVHIITDGSGSLGVSRYASSEKLISSVGAQAEGIFGLVADAALYEAILTQKFDLFRDLVDFLADQFSRDKITFVAGDAIEGFNPAHDICREIINGSIEKVRRRTGRCIENYEFCLTEWEGGNRNLQDDSGWEFRLNDQLLDLKLSAAMAYSELHSEIEQAVSSCGKEYFRVEYFKRVSPQNSQLDDHPKPFYEARGEQRVAEGKYGSVIRFSKDIKPIFEAIRRHGLA